MSRPADRVRGPLNNGGLYGERNGWYLPGFQDRGWADVTLPYTDPRPVSPGTGRRSGCMVPPGWTPHSGLTFTATRPEVLPGTDLPQRLEPRPVHQQRRPAGHVRPARRGNPDPRGPNTPRGRRHLRRAPGRRREQQRDHAAEASAPSRWRTWASWPAACPSRWCALPATTADSTYLPNSVTCHFPTVRSSFSFCWWRAGIVRIGRPAVRICSPYSWRMVAVNSVAVDVIGDIALVIVVSGCSAPWPVAADSRPSSARYWRGCCSGRACSGGCPVT